MCAVFQYPSMRAPPSSVQTSHVDIVLDALLVHQFNDFWINHSMLCEAVLLTTRRLTSSCWYAYLKILLIITRHHRCNFATNCSCFSVNNAFNFLAFCISQIVFMGKRYDGNFIQDKDDLFLLLTKRLYSIMSIVSHRKLTLGAYASWLNIIFVMIQSCKMIFILSFKITSQFHSHMNSVGNCACYKWVT